METTNEAVVQAMQAKGFPVTPQQYEDWLSGEGDPEPFDQYVRQFLGEEAYQELDQLARLDAYLLWKLGVGPNNAGGVRFAK